MWTATYMDECIKKLTRYVIQFAIWLEWFFNIDLVAQQVEHYTYEFSIISKNRRMTYVVQLIECAGLEINQHGSQV